MADNLFKTLINTLDDISEKPTEAERWSKLLSSKDWRHPLKYGELTPDGFIAAFSKHPYSDWPQHAPVYAHIFNSTNATTSDVLRMIKLVASNDPYWASKQNVLYLDMYKSFLEYKGLPLTAKALDAYTDMIPVRISAENKLGFIESVTRFAQTPEDKVLVKDYLVKKFEDVLLSNIRHNPKAINSAYAGVFALIEHLIPDINNDKLLAASKQTMDLTSQLLLVSKNKYSIVDYISSLVPQNTKSLLNMTFLEDLTEACQSISTDTISEAKWPADLALTIANSLPSTDDYNPQHLHLITILSYLGVDTKALEDKIFPALLKEANAHYISIDYSKKIFTTPKQEKMLSAWIEIEFNYNNNLSNANNSLSDDEIVSVLRKSEWFPKRLNALKDKVNAENFIRYVSAVEPNDINWPSLAGKLIRMVQTGKINARSTIKKIKDFGFKIPGPIPRDMPDIDALVYALSGLKSDSLRTAATALDIRTSSEEYANMVVEHIRGIKHPETNKAIELPMLDVSV